MKSQKKQVCFRIDSKLLEDFKKALEKEGATLTNILLLAVKNYVKAKG